MLVDSDGNRTRTGYKYEGSTKVRVSKKNGQTIVSKKSK